MEEFGSAERIKFRLVRLNSSVVVVIHWFVLYNIRNRPLCGHHNCQLSIDMHGTIVRSVIYEAMGRPVPEGNRDPRQ